MSYTKTYDVLMSDQSVSFRLRNTLEAFNNADIVDALNEAECLVAFLRQKNGEEVGVNYSFSEHIDKLTEWDYINERLNG